jgi:hypothetical protein
LGDNATQQVAWLQPPRSLQVFVLKSGLSFQSAARVHAMPAVLHVESTHLPPLTSHASFLLQSASAWHPVQQLA